MNEPISSIGKNVILCLLGCAAICGYSDVPDQVSYEGRLLNTDRTPYQGAVPVAVAIYDSDTGGNILYTQHVGNVSVHNGLYSFKWGGAMLSSVFTNSECWLQAHINGEILTPRQRLASVPYAIRVQEAVNASTLSGASKNAIAVPAGVIIQFGVSTPPAGYLLCDGSTVSRTTYSNLFAVIGITYGQGDGSTTFHLPDYRGRFVRGVDGGSGRDPDAGSRTASATGGNTGDAAGTLQSDAFDSHSHTVDPPNTGTSTAGNHSHAQYVSANCGTGGSGHRQDHDQDCSGLGTYSQGINTGTSGNHSHTVNIGAFSSTSTGGTETRPINISAYFIIKY